MNPTTIIALRVLDLRGECEAQLRAVMRLEAQLRKTTNGNDVVSENLAEALRRELAEMLANNANIRHVLNELATEAQSPATPGSISPKPHRGDDRAV